MKPGSGIILADGICENWLSFSVVDRFRLGSTYADDGCKGLNRRSGRASIFVRSTDALSVAGQPHRCFEMSMESAQNQFSGYDTPNGGKLI
jgi:hypothetical protein